MNKFSSSHGFTNKELVMVIVVLAILCLLAVPPFYALQNAHRRTGMEKTVMALETALKNGVDRDALPAALDANPVQSPCLTCFDGVLNSGVADPLWYKFTDNVYLFSTDGNHGAETDYQETGDFKITYDALKGSVLAEEIRPSR